jgi:glycosyltransferase involved in cell wall biosynthesis
MKKISVLIDATYISGGGGLILLIDLVKKLLNDGFDVGLILDRRLGSDEFLANNSVCCIYPNIFMRELSILRYGKKFDVILCFNNIGTFFRYSFPLVVYFHNVLYLNNSRDFKFLLKKLFFIFSATNVNVHWVCQTNNVQVALRGFLAKFLLKTTPLVFPFFPLERINSPHLVCHSPSVECISFVYVSDGHLYKNHYILLDAFCMLVSKGYDAELSLTVSNKYPELLMHISYIKSLGYKINNHLNIPHVQMANFLRLHDVAVYPSSFESFGLGLIEAAQNKLPIIASNLSYVTEVVNPFCLFDHTSKESIYRAMVSCFENQLSASTLAVKDQSRDFFNFLRSVSRYVS